MILLRMHQRSVVKQKFIQTIRVRAEAEKNTNSAVAERQNRFYITTNACFDCGTKEKDVVLCEDKNEAVKYSG